jgi:GH25 family lysozyme M1 (1,4-beta-N-acetylmuramidase)
MMFPESASAKPVDKRFHRFRQDARTSSFSIGAYSDNDIERYNLETAQITGEDNPRTYLFMRNLDTLGETGVDIRSLKNR